MFKPHITVATVVQAQNKFLVVAEYIDGTGLVFNQPAGHLEAGETLIQAAERELFEETGIQATPQHLLNIYQWIAPDSTPFIRFTFAIDLPSVVETAPKDDDIEYCLWLTADEIISANNLRSPLVRESVVRYLEPARYPLSLLTTYGRHYK